MTIHETYEKWKHYDHVFCDCEAMELAGEDHANALFDLWQAVRAEATKQPIGGYWLCADCETVHPYHYLRLSTVACKCGIGKGRWEAHPFQIKEAPCPS